MVRQIAAEHVEPGHYIWTHNAFREVTATHGPDPAGRVHLAFDNDGLAALQEKAALVLQRHQGHYLTVEFDASYAPVFRLICPESGCEPPGFCEECGWHRGDPETKRNACCPASEDECWLRGWVENGDVDEYLSGKVALPIHATWDGDGPLIEVGW